MTKPRERCAAIALTFLIASVALAADAPSGAKTPSTSVSGHWLGTLKVGGIELHLATTIQAKPDGTLSGTFNSLDQDRTDHPLDEVTFKDGSLRFAFKQAGLVYEGKPNAAATEITGQLKQLGAVFPLVFKKSEKSPEPRKRPQEPKRPFPYREEEVTFENTSAHAKFAGTLTLPRSSGRHPAVLLITGSGQQDRDESILGHRPFLVLADHLTRNGIAVLRVDDRGVGGSTGDVLHATTEDFAGDALAAVSYLKTRPEIDPHHIGLIGHSEGGLIAPMLAVRSSDVAFIVLLAGPGVSGDRILLAQVASVLKQNGAPDALATKTVALQEKMHAAVKQETDAAALNVKVKQLYDEYAGTLSESEKKLSGISPGAADRSAKLLGSPWFRFFLTYDPRPALTKVRCPVLALVGEKDFQVPAKENVPELEKALRAGGNKDFTVLELPHLNHLFQTSHTGGLDEYARIEETIAPSVLDLITDWIRKRTGSPGSK
jgi:uncharacterized protein